MNGRIGPELGAKIREMRERRRLTQNQLASLTRKSVETISNFERGKTIPSVQTLAVLADVLNVGVGAFFDVPKKLEERASAHLAIVDRLVHLAPKDVQLVAGFVELLHRQRHRTVRRRDVKS
jgi:transcriptional regulator with XRE-family HTH domain